MSTPSNWLPASPENERDPFAAPVSSGFAAPLPFGQPQAFGQPQVTQSAAGPYPQPGYSYGVGTYPASAAPTQPTNGLSIASLVLGVVAVVIPLTAPVAIVLGVMALRAIKRDLTGGQSLAIAGITIGSLLTATYGAIGLFVAVVFATAGW